MTAPADDSGPSTFLDSLGDRGRRRAEPRTSIAIAGAGCALGVLGVLVVAGDTGASGGDFNRVPGLVLSALVVAAGFFVLAATARGAVGTAGTVAAALGVPPFMFFLTFDQGGLPPYSTEGILIVSTLAWLIAYVMGPGRGRPFLLGAGLIGFWATVLQLTENLFDAPWGAVNSFFGTTSGFDSTDGSFSSSSGGFGSGSGFHVPDAATVGVLSLVLGVSFLLLGRWLDRQGRHGVATPFAVAALPALAVGAIGLAPDLEPSGTGLLLVVTGLALACNGASVWRRATTWLGSATAAFGLALFLGDMAGDSASSGGLLFIAGGIAMVFGGHVLTTALKEADEMTVTLLAPVSAGVSGAEARRRITPLVAEVPVPAPPAPAVDDSPWAPPPAAPVPPPPPAPPIPPPPPPAPTSPPPPS